MAAPVSVPTVDPVVTQAELSTRTPAPPAAVRSADILTEATAGMPLGDQNWGYECYGAVQAATSIPRAGVTGNLLVGAPSLRLGIETPPNSPSRAGIVLRTASGDPEASGSPRCELSFVRGTKGYLPKASTFWFTATVWLDDWRGTDDEQLVAQFHDGDWSRGLNPFFALLIRGNQARVNVRWDTTQNETIAKTHVANKDIWSGSFDFSRRWVTFVVQARTSTRASDAPFVRVWRDGQLIANYSGPVGYNQPEFRDYAKVGYYHWLNGNPWDQRMPVRTVYVRRATVISDAQNLYTEPVVRAHVDQ